MTKDIQTILDKWLATGEASICGDTIKLFEKSNLGNNINITLYKAYTHMGIILDGISINEILLDSNLFEVLFGGHPAGNNVLFQSKKLLPCSYTNIPSWKYHKGKCLLLDTQGQRVKYILQNLPKPTTL